MPSPKIPTRESHVEAYLTKQAQALGAEVRKVQWIGRNAAPDRVLMIDSKTKMPPTVWVEVKSPSKGPKFPSNAHERAQGREHDRMRAAGQHVFVIWNYAGVDLLLGGYR